MKQDEIIEMARQAGARQMVSSLTHPNGPVTALKFDLDSESIEAFAKMVAAKERADEREACAKLCDNASDLGLEYWCDVAEAIRNRGEA